MCVRERGREGLGMREREREMPHIGDLCLLKSL